MVSQIFFEEKVSKSTTRGDETVIKTVLRLMYTFCKNMTFLTLKQLEIISHSPPDTFRSLRCLGANFKLKLIYITVAGASAVHRKNPLRRRPQSARLSFIVRIMPSPCSSSLQKKKKFESGKLISDTGLNFHESAAKSVSMPLPR